MPTNSAQLVAADEGPRIGVVGDVYRFLATGADTGGKYAVWEASVPPGGGPPLHVHSRESEGFFVLEGEITIRVEEQSVKATAGTFVNLEPGIKHAFRNESDAPARMLIMVAPAGIEKMFAEVGTVLDDSAESAPPPSHDEIARLLSVAGNYGITIFPPDESGH